jgi:antagonist of KipI
MSLLVLKSGLLDTVQDLGRHGYAHLGIHRAGAMDPVALQVANMVVGNLPGTAGLEMHFPAPMLQFEQDTVFAIGGADFDARLDGMDIPLWTPVKVRPGSVLVFKKQSRGMRGYLAVKGGFQLEPWLGSCSTSLVAGAGGWQGRGLRTGDRLPFSDGPQSVSGPNRILPWRANVQGLYPEMPITRFLPGPEFELLGEDARVVLESAVWKAGLQSNRMACALEGPGIFLKESFELVSSAVQPGTVQLLPGGELLVLMADCQTTGGYPRIAQILQADLPALAQIRPGTSLQLQQSTLESASVSARQQRQLLRQIRWGCLLRGG